MLAKETLIELNGSVPSPDIVAVIPAYNEERFICSVVITALQYADHVVVVDDGSTDRTAELAERAGAEVIRQPQNGGKGAALNAGFERAMQLAPRVVVTLDADAQHDPAEIPQMVQPILHGNADVVIGSRFLETRSEIPAWRQVGQHALTKLTNAASGTSTTDSQSGFRAFALPAIRRLRFRSPGLAMESEMQFLLQESCLRVTEVPISVQYRDGNKRNPFTHGLQIIDAILTVVARRRPLLYIGLPGLLLTFMAFICALLALNFVLVDHVIHFGLAVCTVLLLFAGLLLTVTGVILNSLEHFIKRLQDELQMSLRQHRDESRA